MRVRVRLFARLRDIVGTPEIEMDVPAATIGDVWAALTARHPELGTYTSSISCARNEEYARMGTSLEEGDEVAFLPPVSGGQGHQRNAGCRA
jgi:molybdopterin converting factor subunit 1